MSEHLLMGVAAIIVLGILAQWIAWRIHLPSILILLLVGFLVGPVTGFLNPEQLFGDILFPIISVSVAVILFEGGLSLEFVDVKGVEHVVRRLVSVGVAVTWILGVVAAYLLLELSFILSLLLGAIMVVTGPTVIIPLLQHLRLTNRIGSIARWEGIIIDPIGALLAVLVFEVILLQGADRAATVVLLVIGKTLLIGIGLGVIGAAIMILFLKKYWIPDFLQSPVTLMLVITVFTLSNIFQAESGLLAVTAMGMVLANQRFVTIKHIVEFKENLRVLLISGLFILLAARLNMSAFQYINPNSILFLVLLIFIVRPLSVLLSTIGSNLNWRERVFLFWMAPRGIVAAAVSSVFALHLTEQGQTQAAALMPVTFLVIVGTVTFYGLTATPVARWLNLAHPNPQGMIIVGAHSWARELAKAIQNTQIKVLLVDTNWQNISTARIDGIPAYMGNILAKDIFDKIDLTGLGRLIALTPNNEVNNLANIHFLEFFERAEVYQLSSGKKKEQKEQSTTPALRGRLLFGLDITYEYITDRIQKGAIIKKTPLTKDFNYDELQKYYRNEAIPLFLINEDNELKVFATDNRPEPKPGNTLISLVEDIEDE